jgi:Uma2 family endonuclease
VVSTSLENTLADVLLVIEVADSSVKLPLYVRFGIPELWIVDIANKTVEVLTEPQGDAFAFHERRTSGTLTPKLVPSVTIDVVALLA